MTLSQITKMIFNHKILIIRLQNVSFFYYMEPSESHSSI